MQRFANAIKVQAGLAGQTFGQPRFGTITSFNPSNFTARVQLQPEGTISGWLPVLSPWTGNGWGMVCPLIAGDQVLIIPHEGQAEHWVIIGRSYSNVSVPPPAAPGELWIVHSSGSSLKLRSDGTIAISGDLHVNGDIYDRHGSLAHLRLTYDGHTHISPSGGNTSLPSTTD